MATMNFRVNDVPILAISDKPAILAEGLTTGEAVYLSDMYGQFLSLLINFNKPEYYSNKQD